ncbi:LysR family transcriptional regulator [Mesorhizobium sp. AR10]|uniref:LysR family transcriptional regulator n=1 Tax=Mesorhizobium sp. AR10 TaxID=2865839 RepID=UPI0021600682|nr:LysR family transcriptional regulator [Mesorhizobium sp. AR10]UVK38571.1 LysR family transcriptional regulator [Mesorhizobium sp. AR10]
MNLLPILLVVGEELNLTRASERLGLSQPALSHALARLREQFGDALFVRGQRGLIATPRVETLLPAVREVIERTGALYEGAAELDLAGLQRTVVIASTAYFEARAVPALMKMAQQLAPGLRFETRSLSGGFPKAELESGAFDVAIAAYFADLPAGLRQRTIFTDRFVCVCAKENPYLGTGRALDNYLKAKHLQIEVPPGVFAPVDQYLQSRKKQRTIAVRIGNFLTPAQILGDTDYLLTCPRSLAAHYADAYPLAITELPFKLPAIDTLMVWHEKNHNDAFHSWLRTSIAKVGLSN